MTDIVGIIVALVVAVVIFWLLGFAVPTFIAALVALLAFLALVFGRR